MALTPVTTSYILLSTLTILLYDCAAHLDEEIDFLARSKTTSAKVIFILSRYLPFVIGVLRIPTDLAGAQVQDDNMCFALLRSSIWLCIVLMSCVESIFLLRTYVLWDCSKRVLLVLSAMYLATVIVTVISVQRYTEFSTGQSCYTDNPGPSSAILPGFLALGALEIGLFGITMYRVLSQYRTASGRLLNLLVRHNIVYFAASVALNGLNIIGFFLDPEASKWHSPVFEIAQLLFQGLLGTRLQLHLWKVHRRTTDSTTMDTISMAEFAVRRSHLATSSS